MFDEKPNQEPEDMLSSTTPVSNPLSTGGLRPTSMGNNLQQNQSQDFKKLENELMNGSSDESKKSFLKPIIIILVVVLVLVGGYFAFAKWGGTIMGLFSKTEVTPVENVKTDELNNGVGEAESIDNIEVQKVEEQLPAIPVDSDRDGLSDEEEITLGTDKNLVDTDSDGINDNAEVNIYKTNPLKADTDGDGYNDGQEIISNYDPNDATPGKKLFTIEGELNKTNPDLK